MIGDSSSSKAAGKVSDAKAKLWSFKAKLPDAVLTKTQQAVTASKQIVENVDELGQLSCGCNCRSCKETYKNFWLEKGLATELGLALTAEKNAMAETIELIKELEVAYNEQLKDRDATIEQERARCKKLSDDLEFERSLRIEEVFRLNVAQKELETVMETKSDLERQVMSLKQDLQGQAFLNRHQQTELKESAEAREAVLRRLYDFSSHIAALEGRNEELRMMMFEKDIAMAKEKQKIIRAVERDNNIGMGASRMLTQSRSQTSVSGPMSSGASVSGLASISASTLNGHGSNYSYGAGYSTSSSRVGKLPSVLSQTAEELGFGHKRIPRV
jgi:chromosome segregation ATPase